MSEPFRYVVLKTTGAEEVESSYTYDRIVLGTISSLLLLFVLFQIIRTIYYKHKKLSFHFGFLILCFLWMTLRVIYWFMPETSCFILFLYWLPICIEFATFSLLLVFFTYALNSTEWNTPLIRRHMRNDSTTVTPIPSPSRRSPTVHSSLNNAIHHSYYTNGGLNPSWEQHQYEAHETSINDEPVTHPTTSPLQKFTDTIIRRDVLYFTLYAVSNLAWLGVILGMSIYVCEETDNPYIDIPNKLEVMSIIGASAFCLIMFLLLVTGVRLAIRIHRRHDLPLSLKFSGLSGPSILVVIGLNSTIFITRVVVNILPLLPSFPENFFRFATLRMTDYGKMIIISSFVVWEIVPIITVLFFFSRIMPSTKTPKSSIGDGLQNLDGDSHYNAAQEYYKATRNQQKRTLFDYPTTYEDEVVERPRHEHVMDLDTSSDDCSISSEHDHIK